MKWALALGVFLALTLFTVWFFDRRQEGNTEGTVKPVSTAPPVSVTKSDAGEGGVTVTGRPTIAGEDVIFEFAMDTHSGDLTSFSVLEKASLVSGGKEVLPKDWQETANSGHHRAGRLVFEAGEMGEMRELEFVVRDLGGIPERKLEWTL